MRSEEYFKGKKATEAARSSFTDFTAIGPLKLTSKYYATAAPMFWTLADVYAPQPLTPLTAAPHEPCCTPLGVAENKVWQASLFRANGKMQRMTRA